MTLQIGPFHVGIDVGQMVLPLGDTIHVDPGNSGAGGPWEASSRTFAKGSAKGRQWCTEMCQVMSKARWRWWRYLQGTRYMLFVADEGGRLVRLGMQREMEGRH